MSDAQQGLAPDCLQRALRSRFRQQVKPGVGRHEDRITCSTEPEASSEMIE
jgi:phage baseplate assembly protein W